MPINISPRIILLNCFEGFRFKIKVYHFLNNGQKFYNALKVGSFLEKCHGVPESRNYSGAHNQALSNLTNEITTLFLALSTIFSNHLKQKYIELIKNRFFNSGLKLSEFRKFYQYLKQSFNITISYINSFKEAYYMAGCKNVHLKRRFSTHLLNISELLRIRILKACVNCECKYKLTSRKNFFAENWVSEYGIRNLTFHKL